MLTFVSVLQATIDIREGLETYAPDTTLASSIDQIIAGFVNAAIVVAALLFLIYLIWGAVSWITAGGDKGAVERARERIIHALIGLVLTVFAYALYLTVLNVLNIHLGQDAVGGKARPASGIEGTGSYAERIGDGPAPIRCSWVNAIFGRCKQ